MKKVAIICSTGMTSSILAKKIQEVFEGTHIIEAENYGILSQHHDYDLIFLSPQFHYEGDSSIVKILPPNLYNIFHASELTCIIQELLEKELNY